MLRSQSNLLDFTISVQKGTYSINAGINDTTYSVIGIINILVVKNRTLNTTNYLTAYYVLCINIKHLTLILKKLDIIC